MKLKKQLNLDIDVNPQEVAYLFQSMDDTEQAEFFNHLADYVKTWGSPFCFQMQSVINNGTLTSEAKSIMKDIGDYSNG
jgi:hypothetical protein